MSRQLIDNQFDLLVLAKLRELRIRPSGLW